MINENNENLILIFTNEIWNRSNVTVAGVFAYSVANEIENDKIDSEPRSYLSVDKSQYLSTS